MKGESQFMWEVFIKSRPVPVTCQMREKRYNNGKGESKLGLIWEMRKRNSFEILNQNFVVLGSLHKIRFRKFIDYVKYLSA